MSEFLNFLSQGVKLEEVTKSSRPKGSKQYNPNPAFLGFRVWADGSVYPSQALVDRFELEYPQATVSVINKEVPPIAANATEEEKAAYEKALAKSVRREYAYEKVAYGIDIIDTAKWGQFPKGAPRGLLVGITPKTEPKVDLFSEVRYSEEGKPTVSVMDQGSETFGKKVLFGLIKEVYGVDLEAEDGPAFVDLNVITTHDLKQVSSNGVFHLPKVIARGENAGKPDYTRRENISIFPLDLVVPQASAEAQDQGQDAEISENAAENQEA